MIAFLSPAKNIRPCLYENFALTRPQAIKKSGQLLEEIRKYSPWQLESLLKISPRLAMQAFADFSALDLNALGSPALLAYQGLAYWNLNPLDFSADDFIFAQKHLRIISSFYGVLRPMDGIQPYRMELGCKLRVNAENLYAFWGDSIRNALFLDEKPVINLSSGEYSKAVLPRLRPQDTLITCVFMTYKRGKLTTLATGAKMARGKMARFIIKNRLETPTQLKEFDWDDYHFANNLSDSLRYVFVKE